MASVKIANATVTIGWTSDLANYDSFLTEAVEECARVIPGCHYIIVGANEIANSTHTADIVLKQAVGMSRLDGWIIDPLDAVQLLNLIINNRHSNTDYIILLTKQKMTPRQIGDRYEYHLNNSAVISLKPCQTIDDMQKFTTLMLEHVMGHFYIEESPHAHCITDHCTMSDAEYYHSIMELAECEKNFSLDSFCGDCKERLRASELWNDDYPSTVEHR